MNNKLLNNKKWLFDQYFVKKLSTNKIAKFLNYKSPGTIYRKLIKFGFIPRTRSTSHKGKKPPNFIGKRDAHGYVEVYAPEHIPNHNNFVYEHRLVMENHLGRRLKKNEIVHHIDGDKKNNIIQNLQIYTSPGKHLAHGHHLVYGKKTS